MVIIIVIVIFIVAVPTYTARGVLGGKNIHPLKRYNNNTIIIYRSELE